MYNYFTVVHTFPDSVFGDAVRPNQDSGMKIPLSGARARDTPPPPPPPPRVASKNLCFTTSHDWGAYVGRGGWMGGARGGKVLQRDCHFHRTESLSTPPVLLNIRPRLAAGLAPLKKKFISYEQSSIKRFRHYYLSQAS